MAEAFDPYLRWLGIRDSERPLNHYRLLGLDLFESDPDIIAVAADRQMAHLRTFKTSQYVELSQRLLNELAAARVCLLKPERKAAYDEQLRRKVGDKRPPVARAAATTAAAVVAGPVERSSQLAPSGESASSLDRELQDFRTSRSSATGRRSNRSRARTNPLWIAVPLVALAAAVGTAVYVANSNDSSATTDDHGTVAANTGTEKSGPGTPTKVQPPATGHSDKPNGSTTPNKNPRDDAHDHHGDHTATNSQPHSSPGSHSPNSSIPTVSQPAETVGPPKPPIQSPGDVMRVVNPPQPGHDPNPDFDPSRQVASANTGHEPAHVTPDHGKPKSTTPAKTDGGTKAYRAPVPSKDETAAAEAKIQKLFNVSAAKRPDERAALAKTLFDQGSDADNAAADRYVCLRTAIKDAAGMGDADLALKAVDRFTDTFDVNALDEKLGVLSTLGRMVHSPATAQSLAAVVEGLLEAAIDADDFDSAKSLTQLGAGFAGKAGNASLAKEFRQRGIELEQIKKEFATAAPARDTLQSKPDDPEANYVWGYYVGPIKGDFDSAIPFLAKGNNESFQAAASKELAKPADPTLQVQLGDAWSALAEKVRPSEKAAIQSRAADWYARAIPKLKGIAHTEAEQKLAQLEGARKLAGARDRKERLARMMVAGTWRLIWDGAGGTWNLNFLPDHTVVCNGNAMGPWAVVDSDTVEFRWTTRANWVHRLRFVKDHFEAERYEDGVATLGGTARSAAP